MTETTKDGPETPLWSGCGCLCQPVGLGEAKLGWQQSFDGNEVLLRVADCLVVCCLLSVSKGPRLSSLITAVGQCTSAYALCLHSRYCYHPCGLPEGGEAILYLSV